MVGPMHHPRFSAFFRRTRAAATGTLLATGLLAGAALVAQDRAQDRAGGRAADGDNPPVRFRVDPKPLAAGTLEPNTFRDIAERVSPSVVTITTETAARTLRGGEDLRQMDPFFREFFGERMPQFRQPPQAGLGSGVIIGENGYVATNNHVIEDADTVTVTLTDGREFRAEVVGRDPQTDIALLKIDAQNLPALTFGDSSQIAVGDRVLAVGSPFGLGGTVTTGIVSATGRRAGIGLAYEDFIQTDAAINVGNSGGALVDLQGRLIGLSTAILSRSGGFQGIGLAVPADLVRYVANSLAQHGEVIRGHLGVTVQSLTPALANQFDLDSSQGALVTDVVPNSPAARGGLVGGDIITRLDGNPVIDSSRLSLAVAQTTPGTEIQLEVLRDGRRENVTVEVGEQPDRMGRERGGLARANGSDGVLNGVNVGELDPRTRRQFDVPPRVEGALITSVEPASPSARAGLKPGDVILEINRQPVTNAADAVRLSAEATEKKTLVKLWSRGGTIYTVVDETHMP